ncbi:MAG: glycoside hydrolase family 20 zincin-like fold domain-containing protein [Bacteroidota bacterium]
MKNINIFPLIFLLFFTGVINSQSSEKQIGKKEIIYQADELKNGKFIQDFMMLGAFPNSLPEGVTDYFHLEQTCTGFSTDYLIEVGSENNVKPEINKIVNYKKLETKKWFKYFSPSEKIDLKKIFKQNEGVVAYAAIYIESDKEQEKIFGVGSNDGIKAWFNGEMILKVHKPRTVSVDDEYLKLNLKKGKNLLLLKIEQGLGGWGFVLRPVDNETAWKQVQKNINVAMNSEFVIDGDFIIGTIGDNNIVGQLSNLPMAKVEFSSIDRGHIKTMNVPVGSQLKLPKSDFPDEEYSIKISFNTDSGEHTTYAYLNTSVDVVKELRDLFAKKYVVSDLIIDPSPLENYYIDYINTVKWLDSANKLWEHPYGYRRYLGGLQKAYKGLEELSESNNNFEKVFPQPKKMNFTSEICEVNKNWKIYDEPVASDFISDQLIDFWKESFGSKPKFILESNNKYAINLLISYDKLLKRDDAYILEIEKDRINIKAKSRQGLFYGLSTLLQALHIDKNIPVGKIIDSPAYPVRSVVLTKTKAVLSSDLKSYIKKLADLRYNEIYLPSDAYLNLDDPKKLAEINAVFDFCKSHFIEPVPFIETFGSATFTGILDPCLDEGIYHQKESFISDKHGFIKLGVKRIHDCDNSTIHVFAGEKELVKNADYKLLISEEPKIKIINPNYLQKELKLSFDEVDFSDFPHPASCPSNPKGWEMQDRVISSIIKELKPNKLHISQDEVGFVNRCSLCKARGISNKELMIDQINRVHEIIRKYDHNVGIYIWGDMFSDLQNAPKIDAVGAIEGLPKDIMVNDWNYLAVYHSNKFQTINQMNFYLERGYITGGVAWFEPANILDIMLAGKKYPNQFLGIMHSAWYGYDHSLLPVAEANWTGRIIMGELEF